MIFSADLHAGLDTDNPPGEIIPIKCKDVRKRVMELIDICCKSEVPLIIAGDVYESENPKSYVHQLLFDILNYATSKNVEMYIIPGNHDCGTVWSALSVVIANAQHYPTIHVVMNKPYVFDYEGISICLFPHLPKRLYNSVITEYGTIKKYVKAITGKSSFDVFVTHAHVDNTISSSETELIESGTAMRFKKDEYPTFKLGIFGHNHKHQTIKIGDSTIVFPGSVIMNDFGERKDVKGYIELGPKLDWKFKEFKSSVTKYKQIKLDLLTQDVLKIKDVHLQTLKGYLLKIIVCTDDIAKVDEIEIRNIFNKYSYVVRFERVLYQPDRTSIDIEEEEDVVFVGLAYDKLLKQWLDKKDNIPDRIKEIALSVGKEVMNA